MHSNNYSQSAVNIDHLRSKNVSPHLSYNNMLMQSHSNNSNGHQEVLTAFIPIHSSYKQSVQSRNNFENATQNINNGKRSQSFKNFQPSQQIKSQSQLAVKRGLQMNKNSNLNSQSGNSQHQNQVYPSQQKYQIRSQSQTGTGHYQANMLYALKNNQLYSQLQKSQKNYQLSAKQLYNSNPSGTDYLKIATDLKKQEAQVINNLNDFYRPRKLKQMLMRQQQSLPLLEQQQQQKQLQEQQRISEQQQKDILPEASLLSPIKKIEQLEGNILSQETTINMEQSHLNENNGNEAIRSRNATFYQSTNQHFKSNQQQSYIGGRDSPYPKIKSLDTSPARNKFFITPEIFKQIQLEEKLKISLKNQPNMIKIKKRMFEIKKNMKKMPQIDFTLRLDAYHTNDNCLHCRKNALDEHIYHNKQH
ncbi:UNKNOWN [Stylonychia lemnae]|uniref:Uncharacterized protein n=1 Tax=Stylonychia lemnae TaxID=5949 RepID=A0A078A5G5_STYLE|nr:UNKNOWN [Stylonychia lemnae]|eukprot:CDW77475.1 UNKNOWN [Stylonychia lemnae]